MENTPEVENKYTELSFEDKQKEIEQLKSSMSEKEVSEVFTIKTEKSETKVPEEKVVVPEAVPAVKLDPQIEMVAQTLMSQAKEKVKSQYKDFDFSGIENANIDTLSKVSLMSTVAEVNAKKMATIEHNLKTENSEGTNTETSTPEFTKPAKTGKVDPDAGKKLLTAMSEQLGFSDEESEVVN